MRKIQDPRFKYCGALFLMLLNRLQEVNNEQKKN